MSFINSQMSIFSSSDKFRFAISSIRTITLVKNCDLPRSKPSAERSCCRSSSLMMAQVSKTMLIPFIADSPLVHNAIAAKNTLVFSKMSLNRFAVGIGGSFHCYFQGFGCGVWLCKTGGVLERSCGRGWRECKDCPACRHVAWHVDSKAATVGYVHGLRNAHGSNITLDCGIGKVRVLKTTLTMLSGLFVVFARLCKYC